MRGDLAWAGGKAQAEAIAGELGTTDFKGCACFLPAYPTAVPTLVVDMVNPHYPDYYAGRRTHAKDDENPKPNYFPAVEAGSAFGFAVLLNRLPSLPGVTAGELLSQAKAWLERAVTQKGVGAKTAAGYGWFHLGSKPKAAPMATPPQAPTESVASSAADEIISQFKSLSNKGNFPAALPKMAALQSDADLRRVFEALVPANERASLRKKNPYWQSFTSGKAGADGLKILQRLGRKLT
ncbi:MAG TPA: type III-B CRISPR module RAMP protein Cmr6 [Candidatus Paceibacterota bacterium]|nr:type III-B CRISPR module RAMP protein Cmr6 [Candidatus Paceibacterota bacterium]